MTIGHAGRIAVLGGALLLTTAGCAAQTSNLPGVTVSPTATSTPTPTDDGGIQEDSDTTLGIVFDDVPTLTGDEADVYDWVATYEKEYWRTLTTNQVSGAFDAIASPEIKATMQSMVTNNLAAQVTAGGTFHARISDIEVQGDTATASTCEIFGETTWADPSGIYSAQDVGFGDNVQSSLQLTRFGEGIWHVASSQVGATC